MKEKYFHMYGKAFDSTGAEHIVTVVGKFEQFNAITTVTQPSELTIEGQDKKREGLIIYDKKEKVRSLKIAYAICHPSDTFNELVGVNIARHRINRGDIVGSLETRNITMLNDDQCNLNVFGELQYIINNIDKYLPQADEETDVEVEIQADAEVPMEIGADEINEVTDEIEIGLADGMDLRINTNNDDGRDLPQAPNFDNLPNLN